jgi:hypothetical protein
MIGSAVICELERAILRIWLLTTFPTGWRYRGRFLGGRMR